MNGSVNHAQINRVRSLRTTDVDSPSPHPYKKHPLQFRTKYRNKTNVLSQSSPVLPRMHMSRLGSFSSAAESSMDNTSNTTVTTTTTANRHKLRQKTNTAVSNKRKNNREIEEERDGEEGDCEVWQTFDDNFRRVQSVLDRNRILIQQVNENHQSKIPDNMVKNVALIQEINGNISKVVSLYSDLSTNFTSVFHQPDKDCDGGSGSE